MSATLERKPHTDVNAVEEIAAIPAVDESVNSVTDTTQEDIATIKKAVKSVVGIAAGLLVLGILFSRRTEPPAPAAPAAPIAVATPEIGASGGHVASFPKELTAHHLNDQEYSLTWKSMGDAYTYRVYYANDKQMHDATAALYKPVEGTTYRFTMNGDPKNVWMAVTPVDGNQNEGILSRPVNIGLAHKG